MYAQDSYYDIDCILYSSINRSLYLLTKSSYSRAIIIFFISIFYNTLLVLALTLNQKPKSLTQHPASCYTPKPQNLNPSVAVTFLPPYTAMNHRQLLPSPPTTPPCRESPTPTPTSLLQIQELEKEIQVSFYKSLCFLNFNEFFLFFPETCNLPSSISHLSIMWDS